MSDFQSALDNAMNGQKAGKKPANEKKTKPASFFSFRTFIAGLVLFFFIASALVFWAWVNRDETSQSVKNSTPSKTAIVDTTGTGSKKNTLTIQPNLPVKEIMAVKATLPVDAKGFAPRAPNVQPKEKETEKKAEIPPSATTTSNSKPMLSFIITDLGLSNSVTQNILKNFSKEIAISLSPYSPNLQSQIDTAKKDGHEAFVTLPLETQGYPLNDTGPLTLTISASTSKNLERLNQLLQNAKGHNGFVAQKDHIFSAEDANVNPAIDKIFTKGHAIIDSNTKNKSFLKALAGRKNYPFAQNKIWLDENLTPDAIKKSLTKINEYGGLNQNVIVMLRPYPNSLKTVQKFLNSSTAKIFDIVPPSRQIAKQYD